MGNFRDPQTCLSRREHGNKDGNIKDYALHFFGCLQFEERHRFFSMKPYHSYWEGVYNRLRHSGMEEGAAQKARIEAMTRCAGSIYREAERCQSLRQILNHDSDEVPKHDPEEKGLVEALNESRAAWKGSRETRQVPLDPSKLTPDAKTIKSWWDALEAEQVGTYLRKGCSSSIC